MNIGFQWFRAAVVVASPVIAASAAADAGVALRDGVLVTDTAAYVMQPGGGIDAVTLSSGASIWSTKAADRPVSWQGDTLVAQRDAKGENALTLVTLDAKRGELAGESVVALPAGVSAGIDEQLGSRFAVHADDSGRNDRLVWRYETRTVRGALDDAATAAPVRTSGVLALSDNGRSVTALTTERAPAQRAAVRRTLSTDSTPANARAFVSEDGTHVLVSRRDRNGAGYRWGLQTRDGDALGDVPARLAYSPFVVRDGVILFVAPPRARRQDSDLVGQPRRLIAMDLVSGDELWSRPVRQTEYTGPFPH